MKIKTLAITALAALLLAGCGNDKKPDPTPEPTPEPTPGPSPVVVDDWSAEVKAAMEGSVGFVLPYIKLSDSAQFGEYEDYPGCYYISDAESVDLLAEYAELLANDSHLVAPWEFSEDDDGVYYDKLVEEQIDYGTLYHNYEVYTYVGDEKLVIEFGIENSALFTDWSPEEKAAMTEQLGEVLPFIEGYAGGLEFGENEVSLEVVSDDDATLTMFNTYTALLQAEGSEWTGSVSQESYYGYPLYVGGFSKNGSEPNSLLSMDIECLDLTALDLGCMLTLSVTYDVPSAEYPTAAIAAFFTSQEITSTLPQWVGSAYSFKVVEDDQGDYATLTIYGAGDGLNDFLAALTANHFSYYSASGVYMAWNEDFYFRPSFNSGTGVGSLTIYAYPEEERSVQSVEFPLASIATYFGVEADSAIAQLVPVFPTTAGYPYKIGEPYTEGVNQYLIYSAASQTQMEAFVAGLDGWTDTTYGSAKYAGYIEVENVGEVDIEIWGSDGDYEFYVELKPVVVPPTPVGGKSFVKVAAADDLTEGKYLIVCENSNVAFDGSLETLDAVNDYVSVTIEEGVIAYSEALENSCFTFEAGTGDNAGKFAVKSANGDYIYNDEWANKLKTSADPVYLSVSLELDAQEAPTGNVLIGSDSGTDNGDTYLKFNAASNQMRFRFYKSGQSDVQLYKLVEVDE